MARGLVLAIALLLAWSAGAVARDASISDSDFCAIVAPGSGTCESLLATIDTEELHGQIPAAEFCLLVADDPGLCERNLAVLSETSVLPGALATWTPRPIAAVSEPDRPPPAEELRVGRSLGDPDAPVRIDVFQDPQCPACGLFTEHVEPLLIAGPVRDGTVFLTYRDMTFLGPESFQAAAAMRVAEDMVPGTFWEYHNVLFHNQSTEDDDAFSDERLADIAEVTWLDREEFLERLDDPRYLAAVEAETQAGRDLGVNSTPTLVINGELNPGLPDWDELRSKVESASAGR